jgi:hypothetical protein
VRAVGEGFDDAVEGGGADVDEDFAGVGIGDGIGEGGVDGRCVEGLDYGGIHGRLLSRRCFSLYRKAMAA